MSERDERRDDRRYAEQVAYVGRRRPGLVTFESSRSAWLDSVTAALRAKRRDQLIVFRRCFLLRPSLDGKYGLGERWKDRPDVLRHLIGHGSHSGWSHRQASTHVKIVQVEKL